MIDHTDGARDPLLVDPEKPVGDGGAQGLESAEVLILNEEVAGGLFDLHSKM